MAEYPDLEYFAMLAGTVGGMLSVGAFLPQAWRIIGRRSAADVSLSMYLAMIAASLMWMFYAYVRGTVELFLTNLVIGVVAFVIAVLRIRYGGQ
jgi:MtN3 and saliva related transmembrane protein